MPVEYFPNQLSRRVEATPSFNGANCLVCVDVPALVTKAGDDWGGRYLRDRTLTALTDADLSDVILAALDAELVVKCPNGAVKVQFLFHHGGGYIHGLPFPSRRRVNHAQLLETVLQKLAARKGCRITKIYFAACSSHDYKQLVDRAFSIPGVSHVVTVDSTIALSCGTIEGLGWDEYLDQPNFQPSPVRVIVWVREADKQVALMPDREVGPDERFNPHSNTVELKSSPPSGPCPTISPLSGNGRRSVVYYDTAASAAAAANAIADQDAVLEAGLAMNKFRCPNPGCQHKRLGPVTVAVTHAYGTRTTLGALIASLFYGAWKYEGVVEYRWTSSVLCEHS